MASEPPRSQRWTRCPPVSSRPGHGTVHPRADGHHNQHRGLGPSPHPSACWDQPCSDEAASLSCHGQTARASTYEPMTPPPLFRRVYFLTVFFSSSHQCYFFKKQSKKKWMLETMKIQNCTSTHYIYCQNLEFVRAFGTPACYG